MSITRHIFRAGLCLFAGAVISYVVAWGFEYRNTQVSPYPDLPLSSEAADMPRVWPVPVSDWPPWCARHQIPPVPKWIVVYRTAIGAREISYSAEAGPLNWLAVETQAGWPMRCAVRYHMNYLEVNGWPNITGPDKRPWYGGLHALDRWHEAYPTVRVPVYLPVKPLWTGLAVNSAFYGCFVAAGAWAVGQAVRANRRRRGLCEVCKYPRGVSPVCTECGKPGGTA
jgi:hypothetical protein